MIRRAALACLLAAIAAAAWPQAAPPRSVSDVLAVIDSHKPDPEAIRRNREAAALEPPSGADRVTLKRFYLARSEAAGRLGMLQKEISDLEDALKVTEGADPDNWLVRLQLMRNLFYAGQYTRGAVVLSEAQSLTRSLGQHVAARSSIAGVHAGNGDFKAAAASLAAAESALEEARSNRNFSRIGLENLSGNFERGRGRVAFYQGEMQKAVEYYARALRHWQAYRDAMYATAGRPGEQTKQQLDRSVDLVEVQLSEAQRAAGKLVDAELSARNVLGRTLANFGTFSFDTALALIRLADAVLEQGRFDDARRLAAKAVQIGEAIGMVPSAYALNEARRTHARTLVELGSYAEADAEFGRRQAGIHSDAAYASVADAGDPLWAFALARTGRADAAVKVAGELFEKSRTRYGDVFYVTAEARGYFALALASKGARAEALGHFRAALPVLLKDARVGSEGDALAKSRRLARILHAYITLLAQMHASGEMPKDLDAVAEAFHLADAARGSRVQVALSASSARAAIRDPELAKLAREAQDGSQRIGSLTAILLDLLARPPGQQLPQVIAQMRKDVDGLTRRQAELGAEIGRRFPEYASLVDPKPVTLEAARKALKPGESLISLLGTEDQTFIWALPQTGAPAFAALALGAGERHDTVNRLRKALDGEPGMLLREIPAFDVALAHALYAKLLVPVEAGWKGATSLVVVPHGGLGQLPFAVLPTEPSANAHLPEKFDSYRQVAWLARKVSLTQLPSVTSLVALRATKVERAPARTFAGFGDPVFGKAAGAPATRTPSAGSAQLSELPQLPDTAGEVREIARALQADEAKDVFLGVEASEKRVKTMDLSDRRVLLFATHGLIPGDLDGLTQPALALSNPAVTGDKDDDGLLAVDEIVGLRLNADLVVLSACNTASGDGEGAEAVSGLGRAFFYAGARALLVSNWPVESVSARLLTTDLFGRVVKEPRLAPAEALRRSMIALIDQGEGKSGDTRFSYAHPTFWAPFTLVGDGQGR